MEEEGMVEKMKKMMKAVLVLMAILTTIYVSAVVYANVNANDDYYIHPYLTSEYVDTPPTEWYTPEELGIVEVWELGNRAVQIVVDRRKEPFPFGPLGTDDQLTVFLYKDEFYTVSNRWVTFAIGGGSLPPWQIPIGGALGVGWVFTGVLFVKGRKKE
jgi:hypothetical protein